MSLVMKNRVMLCLVLLILVLVFRSSVSICLPEDDGGSYRHDVDWSPEFNFTEWSIHQQFFVCDSIYFAFNDNNSSSRVMEVSNTSYARCKTDEETIDGVDGGIVVYKLMEARSVYFIDTAQDHCSNLGMKLAISVSKMNRSSSSSSSQLPSPTTTNTSTTTSSGTSMDHIQEDTVEANPTKKNRKSIVGGWLAFLFLVCVTATFYCVQKHEGKFDIVLPITCCK